MTPGARESDALLVAMYEIDLTGNTYPHEVRRWLRTGSAVLRLWATDLGFGALVTGDYGEVGNG